MCSKPRSRTHVGLLVMHRVHTESVSAAASPQRPHCILHLTGTATAQSKEAVEVQQLHKDRMSTTMQVVRGQSQPLRGAVLIRLITWRQDRSWLALQIW